MKFVTVTTTFEVREEAQKMADMLVEEKLVACGQIGEIESFYTWKRKKSSFKRIYPYFENKKISFKRIGKIYQKTSFL